MKSSYAFPSKLLEESKAKKRKNADLAEQVYNLPEDYVVCVTLLTRIYSLQFITINRNLILLINHFR